MPRGSVSVSGPVEQIAALRDILAAERIVGQVLDINYPFHHRLIENAKDDFLEDMAQIALRSTADPLHFDGYRRRLSGQQSRPRLLVEQPSRTRLLPAGDEYRDRSRLQPVRRDRTSSDPDLLSPRHDSRTAPLRPKPFRRCCARTTSANPVSTALRASLANGGAFDRRKAFGPRNARIVLPPLPFEPADMRHEFTSDAIDLFGRMGAPYSLAGWRIDLSSGSWKNHVDAHLFPDLAEHVVDGKSILPGSAFLDIALSAARQFLSSDQIEISNLEILRPLELAGGHLRELSTTMSGDTGDIEIRSRDRLSGDDWTLHAMARGRRISASLPAAIVPGKRLARAPISGTAAYETARNFGLDYGATFQLLREAVRIGEDRIEAVIDPPAAARNPYVTYSLHPVSVDAAFHGLVAAFGDISGEVRGAPYIPVRFGCARLYQPGVIIRRAMIHIGRMSAGSIKADVTFLSISGDVVATFEDCRFKRTYLHQHKPLRDVSYHQTLIPSRVPPFRATPLEIEKDAVVSRTRRSPERWHIANVGGGGLSRRLRDCPQGRPKYRHPCRRSAARGRGLAKFPRQTAFIFSRKWALPVATTSIGRWRRSAPCQRSRRS